MKKIAAALVAIALLSACGPSGIEHTLLKADRTITLKVVTSPEGRPISLAIVAQDNYKNGYIDRDTGKTFPVSYDRTGPYTNTIAYSSKRDFDFSAVVTMLGKKGDTLSCAIEMDGVDAELETSSNATNIVREDNTQAQVICDLRLQAVR